MCTSHSLAVALVLASVLALPARSQSSNERARCLSISDVDSRVDCLESLGGRVQTAPSPMQPTPPLEDRELDCRNPQDAAQCRELERQPGFRGGSSQPPVGANRPPAVPAAAPPQDDREIDCRDPRDRLMCDQLQSSGGRIANPNYLGQPQPPAGAYRRPAAQAPQAASSDVDPAVAWCTAHTSDPQSIAICVADARRQGPAHVAGLTAQLDRERKAAQDQKRAQEAVAEKLSSAKQQGYQPITFDDFKLDGKQLAGTRAKIMMQGIYKKFGDIESLQASGLAVAMAREYGNGNGIPLLTDDATRNVRKYFLQCGDNPAAPLGCPLTLVGHASICTMTNLVGSKDVPCLAVEDGW
jgi:hypothetical protein